MCCVFLWLASWEREITDTLKLMFQSEKDERNGRSCIESSPMLFLLMLLLLILLLVLLLFASPMSFFHFSCVKHTNNDAYIFYRIFSSVQQSTSTSTTTMMMTVSRLTEQSNRRNNCAHASLYSLYTRLFTVHRRSIQCETVFHFKLQKYTHTQYTFNNCFTFSVSVRSQLLLVFR